MTTVPKDSSPITAAEKANWLSELRSGRYRQGRENLGDEQLGYCCLGVFCLANGVEFNAFDGGWSVGPIRLMSALPQEARIELIKMNDDSRATFAEIADWIEANVETQP